jgi:hypothetical protein
LQYTDWDFAASFENPPNGGISLPNLEAPSPAAFSPASTISDNYYPDDPSHPHLVSTQRMIVNGGQSFILL